MFWNAFLITCGILVGLAVALYIGMVILCFLAGGRQAIRAIKSDGVGNAVLCSFSQFMPLRILFWWAVLVTIGPLSIIAESYEEFREAMAMLSFWVWTGYIPGPEAIDTQRMMQRQDEIEQLCRKVLG
jgi:hypothetical protein